MNRQFKPLDKERKWGIVLFILTIVSWTVSYNATTQNIQLAFLFVGLVSFVTVMTLMAKSVDDNGGWDDPSDPKP